MPMTPKPSNASHTSLYIMPLRHVGVLLYKTFRKLSPVTPKTLFAMHVTPYEIEHRLCEIRNQAYMYQVNV